MTEDIIDEELVNLLKDGDNRPLPSKMIEYVPKQSNVLIKKTDEEIETEVENNLREVIDYGQNAIKDLSDLASQSEHPRPYEALSTLIKSVTDANLALSKLRNKEAKSAERFQEPEKNGNTYTASVADLLDEIDKNAKKKV